MTTLGLLPSDDLIPLVAGAATVAGLTIVGRVATRRGDFGPFTRLAAAFTAAMYAIRALDGLGFIPGLFPASPAAASGLVGGGSGRRRALALAAVGALPLVWAVQWQGLLIPQWGGRYVLLTGAILLVVGASSMEDIGWRRPGPAAMVALSAVVSILGFGWHIERTTGVAGAIEAIEQAPADTVIVTEVAHLGREAGATYGERRWLRARGGTDAREAAEVLRAEDIERARFVGLWQEGPPVVPGYRLVSRDVIGFLGFPFGVWDYQRDSQS